MARIVLIIESKENRRLLTSFLSAYHSVGELDSETRFDEAFDLCIVDDRGLQRYRAEIEARRDSEQPGFVPFLLLTRRHEIWSTIPNLWELVDESIVMPVAKRELQARVEILLRARRISLDLKLRNEDLEAFIQ